MSLGTLILTDGQKLSYRPIEAAKALHYWNILHDLVEPTDEEANKAMHIVDVILPPSVRPKGYHAVLPPSKATVPLTEADIRPLDDELTDPERLKASQLRISGDDYDKRYK